MQRGASILGTRVLRSEDPRLLTTGAVYTEDLQEPALAGALHASFVRSPIAHAHIVSIDIGAASEVAGFVAAYTAADIDRPGARPRARYIDARFARPLLAAGTVRYVGEPVVLVVTERAEQGEDVAELIDIEYDPLPALVDPLAAARDELVLFDDIGTNTVCVFEPEQSDPRLFDGCEVVVSQDIVNQRLAPAPMEPRAAAAMWSADGRLTVWLPNQGAQRAQQGLAAMLGLGIEQVRVITPDVGGAFGAKSGANPEHALVAWAARALERPVRWREYRSDNLVGMTHGRAQTQTVTIGGSRDGTISAYRLEVVQDCGAYPVFGALLPSLTRRMAPGTYDIARIESRARSVVTTTTPTAAYRGAGRPEAAAAIERAVDLFAAEIGMDPAAVRYRNLMKPFTEPRDNGAGAHYDSGDYAAALELALRTAGYDELRREQAARRARGERQLLGIGMATYVEITGGGIEAGAGRENAQVEVHADGTVTVLTGTSPHGQGHATAWAMLASAELGIPMERIRVLHGDTDLVPEGGGTIGSRSLQQGGVAVTQAAQELIELARQRAAEVLEADPADLRLDPARVAITVAGSPHVAITLAELAARERLFAHTVFVAPGATYPFGAHVAIVEVDAETGRTVLQRLVAVDDAGVIVNPLLADGQLHGGIAQGVAQALLEQVVYDEHGNPLTSTFADYAFPSSTDLPLFELASMQTPTSYNQLGAKGIGESGTVGATPAVQNAVIDALAHYGIRHLDMPLTPHRVWAAIRQATAGEAGRHA